MDPLDRCSGRHKPSLALGHGCLAVPGDRRGRGRYVHETFTLKGRTVLVTVLVICRVVTHEVAGLVNRGPSGCHCISEPDRAATDDVLRESRVLGCRCRRDG